jgi:glycosyltransferase involved in cell wall biosynthesis
MASGVPVITSNTSALKEIAEGYGHLVNPLDVDEIANAIAQCMADQEHRQALVKLGLKRADDFQWAKTAEKTLEIYHAALEAPRRRSTIRRKKGSPE